jgi:rubrerythrin
MTLSTLNPWREKGIPLEQQYRTWNRIVQAPMHKLDVDAYTRTRVILMNGLENESWVYSHQFHRCTDNRELQVLLAQTRRVDQQQQTTINWLIPGDQTVLESTLAYEQVAIDLTAYLARHEPDPYVREAFNFGLLEDFDHLYRFSELIDLLEGTDPQAIVQNKTEIFPGRPTEHHHNDPEMRLLRHYEKNRAHPLSKLHILTLLSAEQQTRNFYMEHGFMFTDPLARRLYAEIAEVEEEHVTHYGSLLDPTETHLERMVAHKLMEVYNYHHCYTSETDPRIKAIWDEFLHMELNNLQLWAAMMRKYEGRDPEVLFGEQLVVDFKFQENKDYVRGVLERQVNLRQDGNRFVLRDQLPVDWPSARYQAIVNADGVPSNEIVEVQQAQASREGVAPVETLAEARDVAIMFLREDQAVAQEGRQ